MEGFCGISRGKRARWSWFWEGWSAAREGQAIGVSVHTIAPAAVETEMFRRILTTEQYPTEKTLAPADVAKVIVQCVRGELRHASGEVIYLHKTI